MCKVLKVSRSSYYNYLKKKPSKRELENLKISVRILEIHNNSKKRYGAPKIHKILESEGINISLKRVQRIMRKLDIRSIVVKKYRPISSKKKIECRDNILDRNFTTTSREFEVYITNSKILSHSFSRKGCPYDNAPIESYHASLKKEEVNMVTYYDFNTARLAIFEYIETWYNRRRIHGSIGYITPQQCEDEAKKVS